LARRLAQSVGGEIAAEPTQHGGRFTISLPLA
jgi:signal transduction histidine kinase